jgi:hypothetical protein
LPKPTTTDAAGSDFIVTPETLPLGLFSCAFCTNVSKSNRTTFAGTATTRIFFSDHAVICGSNANIIPVTAEDKMNRPATTPAIK